MTILDVRELTPEGEELLRKALLSPSRSTVEATLRQVREGVPGGSGPALSRPIAGRPTIPYRWFSTWEDAGMHFAQFFRTNHALDRPEVWSWLGLNWLDRGLADNRAFTIGAADRWMLEHTWRRRYRHLLWSPYHIYSLHGSSGRAKALLAQPFTVPGEMVENIASRQFLLTSDAVVQAVTDLYYDSNRKELKTGAASKDAGSVRRFAMVMQQFDRTFDLGAISADELTGMLPAEFDRFRS